MNIRFVVPAVFAAAFVLAGCAAEQQKNATAPSDLSAPITVKVEEADLNAGRWIDPRLVTSVERRIRDDGTLYGVYEVLRLAEPGGSASGYIATQRLHGHLFGRRTHDEITNAQEFDRFVAWATRGRGYSSHEGGVKIATHGRASMAIGYRAIAKTSRAPSPCFVAKTGYRIGGPTTHVDDLGNVDTVVEMVYCHPTGQFSEFEALLANIWTTEPTDLAVIRAKLGQ